MRLPLGSRLSAVLFAATLLGVGVVGTTSSSAASGLTWSEAASPLDNLIPNTAGLQIHLRQVGSNLSAVSCPSKTFCMAVGTNGPGLPTLTEAWDGKHFSVSPGSGVEVSTLTGVSCTGPKFCVAVGHSNFGVVTTNAKVQPVVETWDGSSWSLAALDPHPASVDSELAGVSCATRTSCTAVGFTTDGTMKRTLVESWNGVTWSLAASRNVGTHDNALAGVSCTGPRFCIAVGVSVDATNNFHQLIQRWNGATWTITPRSGPDGGSVLAVSCTDPSFCMAATGGAVEIWRGSSWSTGAALPPPASGNLVMQSVSCSGAHDCVAVAIRGGGNPDSLSSGAFEWNGASWSPGGGVSGGSGTLTGVSCATKRFCVSVGGSNIIPHGTQVFIGR